MRRGWATIEFAGGVWAQVKESNPDFYGAVLRTIPWGQMGTPEEVADVVARAAGHWGSCAEYLHNTVSHLEALGIHDRNLWRLQALVAERIASSTAPPE